MISQIHISALRSFAFQLRDKNLTLFGAAAFIVSQIALILFLSKGEVALYAAGFGILVGIIQVFIRYPRVWIHTIVLGSFIYLNFDSPGIDAIEVIFGIFYLGGIIIWMVWQGFVRKKKIVRNPGDWCLLVFLGLSIINIFVAILNSVPPLEWLREWSLLLLLLYYFPIREYFTSPLSIKNLVHSNIILIILLCIHIVYKYYIVISQGIVYAYQYRAYGTQINETLFMSGVIFGVFASIFSKDRRTRIKAVIFTAASIGALILSFGRTYWSITLFAIVLALPFLHIKYQARFAKYILFATTILALVVFLTIGPRGGKLFIDIVAQRFESTGKGTKDISLRARIVESEEAFQHIKELPLSGNGIRSEIAFYEPILLYTKHNSYMHSGYVGSVYKLGYPLAILLFLPFIYFLWQGFLNVRHSGALPPLIKVLSLGSFYTLMSILLCNLAHSQFDQRMGAFGIVFCISYIEFVKNYRMSNKKMSVD
ncbi:MAG: hypothetical protein V4642_07775 [Bacteroidota bacterium]